MHFSLIAIIVLFQVLLLFIFYNEIYNEKKLETIQVEIARAKKIKSILERSKDNQSKAQANFKNFLSTHKQSYLDSFKQNAVSLTASIDTLSRLAETNSSWKEFHSTKKQEGIKSKMDSILQMQLPSNHNFNSADFKIKPYSYKEVLNSIQVKTEKEVDTVKKKGFFSRIGSALAGKTDVQKEKVHVLVTMKFGNEVSTGDIDLQLAKVFENTTAYYSKGFASMQANLRAKLASQQQEEAAFNDLNLQLFTYSGELLDKYDKTLGDFTTMLSLRFDKQYQTNKTIRNYTIIGLVVLVIIISVILFFFTRLAFGYENKLYNAQVKIQESLNFKNRIVSMISHEIRSPLSIISIYSKFLSTKIQDQEIKNVFDSIKFTTNSLLTLSNQILEFSKNENNKMVLNKEVFNLEKEFFGIAQTLKTLVESNGNTFVFQNNITSDSFVHTDKVKIHQLLYNVIGNANKFTTNGQISLSCNFQEHSKNNYNLEVVVADTGVGISEADLKHVFDKFYQGSSKNKPEVHNFGVGLGLNLCKDLVTLFDGKIKVTSQLQKGTVVALNLILDREQHHLIQDTKHRHQPTFLERSYT